MLAIARIAEIDWDRVNCPGWYPYEYHTGALQEMPPGMRQGPRIVGSTPRAKTGVELVTMEQVAHVVEKEPQRMTPKEVRAVISSLRRDLVER